MSDYVKFWRGTLEEYNAINPKDENCIYFVIGKEPGNLYLGDVPINETGDIYEIIIESSNGDYFLNGQINTDLIATVLKNNVDITSELVNPIYNWKRKSSYDYTENDLIWNDNHMNLKNVISISKDDIENKKTIFDCEVVINGNSYYSQK